jgi:tetratricopeptide (TPR) repeat protein
MALTMGAEMCAQLGQDKEALEYLDKALKKGYDNVEVAVPCYALQADMYPEHNFILDNLAIHYSNARWEEALKSIKSYEDYLKAYEQSHGGQKSPYNPSIMERKTCCLCALKRFKEGFEVAKKAIAEYPNEAGLHMAEGICFNSNEQYQEAVKAYQTAIGLNYKPKYVAINNMVSN